MFNTNNIRVKNTTNFNINACSGGIYKTYLESWFERFHLKSARAENLLSQNVRNNNQNKVILQMVICGDMEVIAEIIDKKDLEKYFSNPIDK